jgi:hypothetical protein
LSGSTPTVQWLSGSDYPVGAGYVPNPAVLPRTALDRLNTLSIHMEDKRMARRITAVPKQPEITWRGRLSLEQRETMIRDAAYFRFVQRGYAHGHDVEDWIAAEAEVDLGAAEPEEARPGEFAVQQSSVHGAAKDDKLKQIVRQHPKKGIPQIEGIDPKEAPLKE